MGGDHSKPMPVADMGKIKVKLDKQQYTVGETVSGMVFLDLYVDAPIDKLYVKAKGKEKTKWEEHWETAVYSGHGEDRHIDHYDHHRKDYEAKNDFFMKKIKLPVEQILPAGKHAYPFNFQIPYLSNTGNKLTSSFLYKTEYGAGLSAGNGHSVRDVKAKVEYSLKVCLDIDHAKDLEKKIDFTVFEQPADVIPVPRGEKTEAVMLCCCINRGDVHMKCYLSKNYYVPGETGIAIMEVKNDSSSALSPAVELNRWLKFRATGHSLSDHEMWKIGGDSNVLVESGEIKTVQIPFVVPLTMPSTDGWLVECKYRIDIVAEITMAPDIEIQFPLNVFMPPIDWAGLIGDTSDYVVHVEPCAVEDMIPPGSNIVPPGVVVQGP